MAGERQITEGITTNFTTDEDGLVTIVDTLRYTFAASDDGQTVRCITEGSWIDVEQDDYQASALLNVKFSPQPQDPITQHGFVEGQTGYIAVNFTSNPPPTRAWWTTEDEGNIDVPTELANFSTPNQPLNYEAYPLKPVNDSQTAYEAVLRLKTITKQHANMVYRLSVESIQLGQSHLQEYTVHISLGPFPLSDFNVVASTVGILLVIIVICCVVAWWFTGRNGYTSTGTGSGVDEKNTLDKESVKRFTKSEPVNKETGSHDDVEDFSDKERAQQLTLSILLENYPDMPILKI